MTHHLRPPLCWAILIVLTLLSVAAAETMSWRDGVIMVIFGVAIIKGQLIAIHFMEVDRALPAWKTLYRVWIVAIGAVLMLAHIIQS